MENHNEEGNMLPPWVRFPTYERHCMGWRMGSGDGYIHDWYKYLKGLPLEQQKAYQEKYPEPKGWEGFYE